MIEMIPWQHSLKNRRELLGISKVPLRYNYERIPINKMADQFFCEMKIEFDEKYQPETSPEQSMGNKIHDSITPMEKVKIESMIEEIESREECAFSFGVNFNYKGVIIWGKHDGVCFQNGIPRFLFEIKSTRGNISVVYPSEKIQAYLYALALEDMGFDTSKLQIIVTKVKMNGDGGDLKDLIVPILFYLNKGMINEFNMDFGAKIYQFNFSEKSKEENLIKLDNLVKFWTKERMPNYSDYIGKCRTCIYNTECSNPELR